MGWMRAVVWEIFGLFVDDGSFAVAILVWLGIALLLLPRLLQAGTAVAVVLCVGLMGILAESVFRGSRKRRR